LWDESERWFMIMLREEKILEEKGMAGGEAASDYSKVSSVDNFCLFVLECYRGSRTSQ